MTILTADQSERLVRADVREALDGWGSGEQPYTGDFLRAVLSNDLREALACADDHNLATLPAIVAYCRNHLPVECWGSRETYEAWARAHRPEGRTYAAFTRVFNRLHLTHFAGTHYEPFTAAELRELDEALEAIPLGTSSRVHASQLAAQLKRHAAVEVGR